MLLGLSLGIWLKRRKEKRVAQEQTKIANIPTEEKYISELCTIDLNDPEVEINTTISRLSNLLRRYLAEKFQAPGLQSTTEDVVKYLETREIDDWGVEKTSEILSTADLIKFSGGVGDKTQLDRIYTLVESILHRYQENKIEEGENKESDKG
jgi:hypothetical protein